MKHYAREAHASDCVINVAPLLSATCTSASTTVELAKMFESFFFKCFARRTDCLKNVLSVPAPSRVNFFLRNFPFFTSFWHDLL